MNKDYIIAEHIIGKYENEIRGFAKQNLDFTFGELKVHEIMKLENRIDKDTYILTALGASDEFVVDGVLAFVIGEDPECVCGEGSYGSMISETLYIHCYQV